MSTTKSSTKPFGSYADFRRKYLEAILAAAVARDAAWDSITLGSLSRDGLGSEGRKSTSKYKMPDHGKGIARPKGN